MRTFTLGQQRKHRKTVYNVQNMLSEIQPTHRPSTQASYTANRVRLNKDNQPWRHELQPDSEYDNRNTSTTVVTSRISESYSGMIHVNSSLLTSELLYSRAKLLKDILAISCILPTENGLLLKLSGSSGLDRVVRSAKPLDTDYIYIYIYIYMIGYIYIYISDIYIYYIYYIYIRDIYISYHIAI